MTRHPDMNARKALDEMKLEIAGELSIKTKAHKSDEVDQNQLVQDDEPDTFNPS